jgi:hypothetical protein
MKRILGKATYANVMATTAVFIALGGASYAALKLPKNSVGTRQIKDNAITAAKIKNGAVGGSKVNLSSLGTVPSATIASRASNADNANHADTADRATSATSAANASTLDGLGSSAFAASSQILKGSAEYASFAQQEVLAFPGGMEILTKTGDSSKLVFSYPGGDRWVVISDTAGSAKSVPGTTTFPISNFLEEFVVRNVSVGDAWEVTCALDGLEAEVLCLAVGA